MLLFVFLYTYLIERKNVIVKQNSEVYFFDVVLINMWFDILNIQKVYIKFNENEMFNNCLEEVK